MDDLSEIQKFYFGKTVFITGATGFIGKLILEKLLRSCPGLRHVYILVRVKKGKEQNVRLVELFECPIFEHLKRNYREFARKITIINGDMALPDLGLSEQDKNIIIEEVDVVFHCAATVRFDQALSQAVRINLRGTRDLLRIAHQMNHLKAFVYVSTAYSNCDQSFIAETIYEPKIDGEDLIRAVEALPDEYVSDMEKRLLGKLPNTYVLTKQISEGLVRKLGQTLPICIVRPSVVIGAVKEPLAGFIDSYYGPTGLVLGGGLGILRTVLFKKEKKGDLVPADYVVNHCIVAAWYIGTNRLSKEPKDPEVMNYVSSVHNPITWGYFIDTCRAIGMDYATEKILFYPTLLIARCKPLNTMLHYLLHMVPAYIVDFIIKLRGGEPKFVDLCEKISKGVDVVSFFPMNEWSFSDFKTRKLLDVMTPHDREIFNFDIRNVDWLDYIHNYIKGMRVYILKDPLDTLEAGRRHYKKLKIIFFAMVSVFFLLLLYLFYLVIF